MRFFVGGYTADRGGQAPGIGALRAGVADAVLAGGQLSYADAVATAGSPSWLAWHPTLPVLYAAMEGAGTVRAFTRTSDERFTALGAPVAVGESVCHVAVAPSGRSLVASCYGDGRVVRVALDERGSLGRADVGASAVDPSASNESDMLRAALAPKREVTAMERLAALLDPPAPEPTAVADENARPSHAHEARFTPAGLVTTDLGLDQLRIWDAGMRERQHVVLPRGTGPRHTLWHPSGHLFVVTEHSCEVFAVRPGADGSWIFVGGTPLVGATPGVDYGAEIAMSGDGRFVYVGLRGSNTIAVVTVRGDGNDLQSVGLADAGVEWPRHHLVERDTLLVAGERSHEIVSFGLDERTGMPGKVRHRVPAPSPTHLLVDQR